MNNDMNADKNQQLAIWAIWAILMLLSTKNDRGCHRLLANQYPALNPTSSAAF